MPLLPKKPDPPAKPPAPEPEQEDERAWPSSATKVWWWRYDDAIAAGLTQAEASLYASSTIDCGQLRRLVAKGCTPPLIAELLL